MGQILPILAKESSPHDFINQATFDNVIGLTIKQAVEKLETVRKAAATTLQSLRRTEVDRIWDWEDQEALKWDVEEMT